MMGQPKPFASLSSGLLARKGTAKPAMRPQGFSGFGAVSDAIDDLGWNDMGHNESQPGSVPVGAQVDGLPLPPVLRQREVLTREVSATAPVCEPVVASASASAPAQQAPTAAPHEPAGAKAASLPPKRVSRSGNGGGKDRGVGSAKAAFTLRLDADRHLRLRLASALHHQSAQQLVTEALDNFLKTLPQVEAMATRLSVGADDVDGNVYGNRG